MCNDSFEFSVVEASTKGVFKVEAQQEGQLIESKDSDGLRTTGLSAR